MNVSTVAVPDMGVDLSGREEARVIGEHAGLRVQLADVHHVGTDVALVDGQLARQSREGSLEMKLADNKATLSFSNGAPSVELPVYQWRTGTRR